MQCSHVACKGGGQGGCPSLNGASARQWIVRLCILLAEGADKNSTNVAFSQQENMVTSFDFTPKLILSEKPCQRQDGGDLGAVP